MVFWLTIFLSSLGFAQTTPAAKNNLSIEFAIEKFQLENGLTVLLYPNESVPLISYHTYFKVGSKDEEPGLTGLAHLFEHMMFKGSTRYSGDQFDSILQSNGAQTNAFTTQDYTGYYIDAPSDKLELLIDLESDRMSGLIINPEKLNSEREVVREERRFRVDNNPMGKMFEALYGTAYRVHSYRWPVIGSMADLGRVNVENATAFYRRFYAPNNAVIAIAGSLDVDRTKRLVKKYYGSIARQEIIRRKVLPEPAIGSPRRQNVTMNVQGSQMIAAFQTPKAGEKDNYALDLAAVILGRGNSSRFYKKMVYRDQSVTRVSAHNDSNMDSGLFMVSASMRPQVDVARAETLMRDELAVFKSRGISDLELQGAKNQVVKGYVDSLKTMHGKASMLALNETLFGDYREIFRDLEKYDRVTKAEVLDVVNKYLHLEKVTTITLQAKAPEVIPDAVTSPPAQPSAPATVPSAKENQ